MWHHLRTWLEGDKRRGTLAPVPGLGWAGSSAAGLIRLGPGTSAAGLIRLGPSTRLAGLVGTWQQ